MDLGIRRNANVQWKMTCAFVLGQVRLSCEWLQGTRERRNYWYGRMAWFVINLQLASCLLIVGSDGISFRQCRRPETFWKSMSFLTI